MTQKEFEEQLVFDTYKDTNFQCCKDFRKQVKEYRNIDVTEVYKKIVNYQIKTFGSSLIGKDEPRGSKERSNRRARQRIQSRNEFRGIANDKKQKRWIEYE